MIRHIKNIVHFFIALFASLFFNFPSKSMTVIGVTGTSGKTLTSHLIYEILKKAGKKVSIVSTVEAVINGKNYDTGFHVTTPSSWNLQKFIKKAKEGGSKYFVLEVTSHALDQHRIFGIYIDIAVVTNIAHEHLDYHGTFEDYRKTKAKIFKNVKYSIMNKDDENYNNLKNYASGKLITYAVNKQADYTLNDIRLKPKFKGDFFLYNCLAAAAVANILGITKNTIIQAISEFKGIPGRMDEIITGKPFRLIIDFAHKPNALREILKTLKKEVKHKLIVVFGCAGLRDKLKRPIMGEIAAELADYIILTAEDPRTEDVRKIIAEIACGCQKAKVLEADKRNKKLNFLQNGRKYFWRIPDRQEAINFSIRKLAKKGDILILCGKGHEKSMCYGKIEYPWDEKKAIEKALYGTVKITSQF